MRSMTGYGQAEEERDGLRLAVVVRTVNHRHLDLALRLPDEAAAFEGELRRLLGEGLERGRVEVRVDAERLVPPAASVEVRSDLLVSLVEACREAAAQARLPFEVRVGDLLQVAELVRIEVARERWTEAHAALLIEVAQTALGAAVVAREREGRQIASVLRQRHSELAAAVRELKERREEVRASLLESLRARLTAFCEGQAIAQERLAQEAALLGERSDVSEELDRLEAHLGQLSALLEAEGAVGRRLDFLLQEVSRELNTLSAKCRDTAMAQRVVDARLLCEQLREQARNVE